MKTDFAYFIERGLPLKKAFASIGRAVNGSHNEVTKVTCLVKT